MSEKRKKVCLIASSGGHYEELLMLRPLEKKFDIFMVTEYAGYKGDAQYYFHKTGPRNVFFPLRVLRLIWQTLRVWAKEKPDAVVSTGTFVSVPMCFLAKFLKKKVVYIETYAKITDCTKTGKFMYKYADMFIYQWESLREFYPNGVYGGSIF